ncbi:MAG TPA: rod shape-determining protein MreC [Baekduia sp.]|nr:rod shape-determining protein MreC [Baekduia sp.]
MYDKTVRRRRLVLAALVAASLLLLTAYFGESAGGGLHIVQRGVMAVVAPIQEGLSRATQPVRDTVGWVGDTVSATRDLKESRKTADSYRRDAIAGRSAVRENASLRQLLGLERTMARYQPVTARVIGDSPTLWYTFIQIDKGSSAGIKKDDPVMGTDGRTQATGLVGKVTEVTRNTAHVTLITDHSVRVSGKFDKTAIRGTLQGSVGDPSLLEMKFVDEPVRPGDTVVTRGTTSDSDNIESLFPPNLRIGNVARIDEPGTDSQVVWVRPFVNMKRVEFVQVLTRKIDGNRR